MFYLRVAYMLAGDEKLCSVIAEHSKKISVAFDGFLQQFSVGNE